jgi:hypothetical protein
MRSKQRRGGGEEGRKGEREKGRKEEERNILDGYIDI